MLLLTPTKINVSRKRYKATKRMNRETAAKCSGSYNSGRPVATDFAQTSHNPADGKTRSRVIRVRQLRNGMGAGLQTELGSW